MATSTNTTSTNTTSTNTTKALSTAHLPIIKSYIDKEIAKKTDGILTGFDDIKAVGLPESDATNKLDIFDCGSGDICSYDYTTGIDTIVNGPKNLTGPFVLVRTREEIVTGAYNGAYDTYAGKQLVRTYIFTTGKKSELLVDGDPLIFNILSIYDPVSGKGYAATNGIVTNWTEYKLDSLTATLNNTANFNLSKLYNLTTGISIYKITNATTLGYIQDLPTNETAANIASVVIRSTSIGEIKNSKIGYIAQELVITRKDGTTVSYLRFLAAPNYDNNFTASNWESKTLLSFKEVSALAMFNSLNKTVDGKISGLNTRVDGIDARVTSLESSGSGSGSSSVTQADIDDIKNDITDIESRLASLGFKRGYIMDWDEIVGYIAQLGKICLIRFIRGKTAFSTEREEGSSYKLQIREEDLTKTRYATYMPQNDNPDYKIFIDSKRSNIDNWGKLCDSFASGDSIAITVQDQKANEYTPDGYYYVDTYFDRIERKYGDAVIITMYRLYISTDGTDVKKQIVQLENSPTYGAIYKTKTSFPYKYDSSIPGPTSNITRDFIGYCGTEKFLVNYTLSKTATGDLTITINSVKSKDKSWGYTNADELVFYALDDNFDINKLP